MKKKFSTLLAFALLISILVPTINAQAAEPTAKQLVKNALEIMKASTSISFCETCTPIYDDRSTRYRFIMGTSDSKYDYSINLDDSQSEDGWQSYCTPGYVYRRSYRATKWTVYTSSTFTTTKQDLEYDLSHYKKIKLVSTSTKNYKIKITPKDTDACWKSAYITINKKSGRITSINYNLAKKTHTYLNSSLAYTITGGTDYFYNISYGDAGVALPDEILG